MQQKAPMSRFAIVSLTLGIISFIQLAGIEKAVAAIVFGILALKGIAAPQSNTRGEGLAAAGIVLGIIYGEHFFEADVLLMYYGIFIFFFSLVIVFVYHSLAKNQYGFVLFFVALSIIEIGVVWVYHTSLLQIIQILSSGIHILFIMKCFFKDNVYHPVNPCYICPRLRPEPKIGMMNHGNPSRIDHQQSGSLRGHCTFDIG